MRPMSESPTLALPSLSLLPASPQHFLSPVSAHLLVDLSVCLPTSTLTY